MSQTLSGQGWVRRVPLNREEPKKHHRTAEGTLGSRATSELPEKSGPRMWLPDFSVWSLMAGLGDESSQILRPVLLEKMARVVEDVEPVRRDSQ